MIGVNVDGHPERREPMTQGQLVGVCLGSVLTVLAAVFGDVDYHGVAALTAGATLVAISAAGPTTAHRLALARSANADRAYMRGQFARLNARLDAMDRRLNAGSERLDGLDQRVAEDVRAIRRAVADTAAQLP